MNDKPKNLSDYYKIHKILNWSLLIVAILPILLRFVQASLYDDNQVPDYFYWSVTEIISAVFVLILSSLLEEYSRYAAQKGDTNTQPIHNKARRFGSVLLLALLTILGVQLFGHYCTNELKVHTVSHKSSLFQHYYDLVIVVSFAVVTLVIFWNYNKNKQIIF